MIPLLASIQQIKRKQIYIVNQSIIETKQLHQYNYNITYLVDYNNMNSIQYSRFSRLYNNITSIYYNIFSRL